ncbi:exosortase family protein XrtF [Nonlabens sp.]|uniref:exosortase family protein XrtF n=1 Tax=Nonlabens sp. TaxID=1888209 RepID=UPI001BCD5EDE|nr:exosortase family protein XrtF [Nonlabens sp.]
MKALIPYYPVFKFVSIFAMLYILFSIGYHFFLGVEWDQQLYPDPITAQLSYQTQELLRFVGYNAQALNSPAHPSVTIFIDEFKIFRIIEGCNSVSVMILFTAFVVAFSRGWKKTLSFLLFGIVFIYIVNLIRLAVLGIVYYDYSAYADFSHEIIFPSVIYGAVVLLWIYWTRNVKPKEVE